MNRLQTTLLAFLLVPLLAFGQKTPAASQPAAEDYLFRFVPGRDMFYVPWSGNAERLDALLSALSENIDALRRGERYISVSSYGAAAGGEIAADRMAYLRCLRVKSELITRGGVTEWMFVTDRHIAAPYRDSLRNVVVVTFPASVEKVAEIAGAEAAAKVEAYNKEISGEAERERLAAEEKAHAEREAAEQAERERIAAEQAAREKAEAERLAAEQAEDVRLALEGQIVSLDIESAEATPYHFALRANLLRWATLTPDLGIEWRISRHAGIAVNGSWTSWSWNDSNRRYALWEVNPEVRWYLGREKRGYVGAMYKAGAFNYKFSETGKQGDLMGGGITGGYQLKLNKALSLDFSLGLGYVRADYEKYTVIDGVRVRDGKERKNWWGPTQAGVTLVWKIF